MARRASAAVLCACLVLQLASTAVLGTSLRTGGVPHHRRELQQDNAVTSQPVIAPKSDHRDLAGKLVLTVTVQADFAPLQDSNNYQSFRAELQQNIAKVCNVPVTDVEVVSLTPGVVALSLVSFYTATAEDQVRVLMNGFQADPTSALPLEFQTKHGKVTTCSSRWIKAKVAGAAPGLTDSQMMGIWISVAIAIVLAITAIYLTMRLRCGWCTMEELDNAKFDPRDLPVPLSISSRRITSVDADNAVAAKQAAAAAPQQQAPLQRKTSSGGANAPGKPPLPQRGPSGNHTKLAASKSTAAAEAGEAGEGGGPVSRKASGAGGAKEGSSGGAAPAAGESKDGDFKLKSASSQQEQ